MKIIEKTWGYHNKTLVLTARVQRDRLVGFDCRGLKKYAPEYRTLVYYGCTKVQCNHRLRIDLNGMDTLRKRRKVASLYEITAISVQYI